MPERLMHVEFTTTLKLNEGNKFAGKTRNDRIAGTWIIFNCY